MMMMMSPPTRTTLTSLVAYSIIVVVVVVISGHTIETESGDITMRMEIPEKSSSSLFSHNLPTPSSSSSSQKAFNNTDDEGDSDEDSEDASPYNMQRKTGGNSPFSETLLKRQNPSARKRPTVASHKMKKPRTVRPQKVEPPTAPAQKKSRLSPDDAFTNLTIKRKRTRYSNISATITFVWPSSSLRRRQQNQMPLVPPTLSSSPPPPSSPSSSPPTDMYMINIHIGSLGCSKHKNSHELCSMTPRSHNTLVLVPLDQWVTIDLDTPFAFSTKYEVRLFNLNISRYGEAKTFVTPYCPDPVDRFTRCPDRLSPLALEDANSTSLPNSGWPEPKIVCLSMDNKSLEHGEVNFHIDWSVDPNQLPAYRSQFSKVDTQLRSLNLTKPGRGMSTVTVIHVRSGDRYPSTYSTTAANLTLSVNEEYEIEIVTRYEKKTLMHEELKLNTDLKTLDKMVEEGTLVFCPPPAVVQTSLDDVVKVVVLSCLIGLVLLFLVCVFCLFIVVGKCREVKMKKTVLLKENSYKSSPSGSSNLLRESVSTCGSVTDEWEIDAAELELGKEIGQGAFGKVVGGMYKGNRVAVKVLKDDIPNLYREDLLREIALLKSLGTHQSIVSILGASTIKEPLALVMEYMPFGNLLNFLKRCHSNFDWRQESRELVSIHCMSDDFSGEKEVWEVTSKDLISWARQIALAMEYLSSKQYVHRDLAARNVLLGSNKTLKLCDFGLARLIYRGDHHYFRKTNGRLPLKWMALESIKDRMYTSRSDVWSFGILLWEIATFGSTPYMNIAIIDLYHYLVEGYRMPQPSNCSDELYLMMMDCWRAMPEDRPTFTELRVQLEDMLSRDVDYLDLDVGNGESPFATERMSSSADANNDKNNNYGFSGQSDAPDGKSAETVEDSQSASDQASSSEAAAAKSDSGLKRSDSVEGGGDAGKNDERGVFLPRLVKLKEIAIVRTLGKSPAGFSGKIADNAVYHKSVTGESATKKFKSERQNPAPGKLKEVDDCILRTQQQYVQHPQHVFPQQRQMEQLSQQRRGDKLRPPNSDQPQLPTRPFPHDIAINPEVVSESFPLLQLSPPPTSSLHSNFRLIDPIADSGEFDSTRSSSLEKDYSGGTEETRSSWIMDII